MFISFTVMSFTVTHLSAWRLVQHMSEIKPLFRRTVHTVKEETQFLWWRSRPRREAGYWYVSTENIQIIVSGYLLPCLLCFFIIRQLEKGRFCIWHINMQLWLHVKWKLLLMNWTKLQYANYKVPRNNQISAAPKFRSSLGIFTFCVFWTH